MIQDSTDIFEPVDNLLQILYRSQVREIETEILLSGLMHASQEGRTSLKLASSGLLI